MRSPCRYDFLELFLGFHFYGGLARVDRLQPSEYLQTTLHGPDACHLELGDGLLEWRRIFQQGEYFVAHLFGRTLVPRNILHQVVVMKYLGPNQLLLARRIPWNDKGYRS